MSKRTMLINALANHPDHELIFMYSEDTSDHSYTLGEATSVRVDEYTSFNERVYFMNDDYEELKEEMEETENTNLLAELEWKKAIIVYVNPKS